MDINWNVFWEKFNNVLDANFLDQGWETQKSLIRDLYPFTIDWDSLWKEFDDWMEVMTNTDDFGFNTDWPEQQKKIEQLILTYKINRHK